MTGRTTINSVSPARHAARASGSPAVPGSCRSLRGRRRPAQVIPGVAPRTWGRVRAWAYWRFTRPMHQVRVPRWRCRGPLSSNRAGSGPSRRLSRQIHARSSPGNRQPASHAARPTGWGGLHYHPLLMRTNGKHRWEACCVGRSRAISRRDGDRLDHRHVGIGRDHRGDGRIHARRPGHGREGRRMGTFSRHGCCSSRGHLLWV